MPTDHYGVTGDLHVGQRSFGRAERTASLVQVSELNSPVTIDRSIAFADTFWMNMARRVVMLSCEVSSMR